MTRFLFALLAFAAVAVAAPVPKAKPKSDQFPYSVGTKWEYAHDGDAKNVYVEEVVEVTEKDGAITFLVNITTNLGQKQTETYRLKDGELVLSGANTVAYDPPMLIAKVGMKTGDEWDTSYGYGNGRAVDLTVSVGKAEEITTPAGKFTALPVTRTTKNQFGNSTTTFWFADGVGMIRQTSPGQTEPLQDLKAFTPGKK